jgi:hypothetical protein
MNNAFRTAFSPLCNAVNSAEEAYKRAWLNLYDYKGAEKMEVIALENTLVACYESLEATKKALNDTYYALPK